MRSFCIVILAGAAACGGLRPPAIPSADLIVATADSSYWVTNGPNGLRMRGVPMLITRVDGRFLEIYSADEDHSYYDAVMVGQRLWARDILRGDSTQLFADTVVPRFATAYARAHPDDEPLKKDDETAENPGTTVTADIEVLGVHGPYISFEYRTDMDVSNARVVTDRHTARRGVLDLRTGKLVTVAALFGAEAAGKAEGDAAAEWRLAKDSLLQLRDRRSRRAQRALGSFAFDPMSFTIEAKEGEPRVVYAVPGEIARGSMNALELQPLAVPASSWWKELRDELPTGADSALHWKRGNLELTALTAAGGESARLTLRDSTRRDWPVGAVAAPVLRVLWLDASIHAGVRKALRKAFNDASMYSDGANVVMAPRRSRPQNMFGQSSSILQHRSSLVRLASRKL